MTQKAASKTGVLAWTNDSGSAVATGAVGSLGDRVGIAMVDIAIGATGSVLLEGVFKMAKDASVIAQEEVVFWSVSASKVTTSPAAGDPRLGVATLAAATGADYVDVEINVPSTAGDTTVGSGAGDAAGNAQAIRDILDVLKDAGIVERG